MRHDLVKCAINSLENVLLFLLFIGFLASLVLFHHSVQDSCALELFHRSSLLNSTFTKNHCVFGFWHTQGKMMSDQDTGSAFSKLSSQSIFKKLPAYVSVYCTIKN